MVLIWFSAQKLREEREKLEEQRRLRDTCARIQVNDQFSRSTSPGSWEFTNRFSK